MRKRIISIVIAGSLILQSGFCLSPVMAAEADPAVKGMSSAEDETEPGDSVVGSGTDESDYVESVEPSGEDIEAEETFPEVAEDEGPTDEDSSVTDTEEIFEEELEDEDAEAEEEAEEDLIEEEEEEDYGIMLLATGPTDIVYDSSTGQWVYVVNGIPDYTYTGVAKNSNGWWYVKDGVVDFTYNGFAENENGKWYIEDGKVTFNKNSVIQDKTGAIGAEGTWWYVVGSKVQTDFTGLADYSNENGWWYIENGKVTFTKDAIAKNKNGWYYIIDSKVDFSFTGLADFSNENGWWYIENGKVTFSKNTVAHNKNGWWYVKDSKVNFNFTGLADFSNENGWWYCENGKVTFKKNTIAQNKNGWFYVKNSKVDFNFTGLADFSNENGWWYCENGKVTFKKDTIAQNKNGWWYVKNSKVDFNFTGLADFSNENGWWYCEGGQVKFNHTGVEKNKNGWFYVKDSKVDFSFTGIASNSNGSWYIKNGKVDFSYNGTVTYDGKTYNIEGGKVVLATPVLNETSWDFDGVKVSWGKVTGADGYMVFRKKSGGSWSSIGTTTSTSFVDANSGSYGTTYYYTVRAYKGDLNTAKANAYSSSYWSSYDSSGVSGSAYQIMGTSSVTANQLIASYSGKTINKELNCTLDELALIFVEEAKAEGVRAEVAWCQTILETGWLGFENCDVSPTQNNYAGIGATGNGEPGNKFDSPREGVRAQIQHLKAYASTQSLNNTCVDPRFTYVTRGVAKFVEILGMQENPGGYGWAGGADYGPHIVRLIKQTGLQGD